MNIGKKEVMWFIAGAVLWYWWRNRGGGLPWTDATGQTYEVTEQQRKMLAAQDAAFSYTQDYEVAPFHGNGAL